MEHQSKLCFGSYKISLKNKGEIALNIAMLSTLFLPTIGGVESHIYNISKALLSRGNNVIVINPIMKNNGKEIEKENIEGITVYRIFLGVERLQKLTENFKDGPVLFAAGFLRKIQYNLYAAKLYKIINKILEEEKIDIVHQHDFSSSILLSKRLSKKIPIVLTNHTGEFLKIRSQKYLKWILKPMLNHFSAIIGPSKDLCDIPFKQIKYRVYYIPNGVDTEKFDVVDEETKQKLREKYGFSKEDLIILCPRRWAPTKGVKYFAEAIGYVEEKVKNNNIKYCFAGNAHKGYLGYSEKIKKILEKYPFQKKIKLLGDVPHQIIHYYYQLSDIIVIPSLMEATSLSALEAMACGKAIVATDVGGLPEIIDDGVNGILVQKENSGELANTLLKLIKDKEKRNQLGQNGSKKVKEEFGWNKIAIRIEETYQIVLRDKI